MSKRSIRLGAAAPVLLGAACLITGIVLEFSVSASLASTVLGVGGLVMGLGRLVERRVLG